MMVDFKKGFVDVPNNESDSYEDKNRLPGREFFMLGHKWVHVKKSDRSVDYPYMVYHKKSGLGFNIDKDRTKQQIVDSMFKKAHDTRLVEMAANAPSLKEYYEQKRLKKEKNAKCNEIVKKNILLFKNATGVSLSIDGRLSAMLGYLNIGLGSTDSRFKSMGYDEDKHGSILDYVKATWGDEVLDIFNRIIDPEKYLNNGMD